MLQNKMTLQIKKKIYWLHPHYLNWMGGHKYIYEIVKRLSNKYSVLVVADIFSKESENKFKDLGLHTITLSSISTNKFVYWVFLPFYIVKDVLYLKKHVHSNDILITSMFPMNVVATLLGAKHIQLCYEPFAFFYDENFVSGFPKLQKVAIKISKFFYSWMDIISTRKSLKVLTISEFNKNWIEKVYKKKSIVVYEGVDTNFFRHTINKTLNKKYEGFEIIFHSTDFTRIKGTEFLVKSMTYIKKEIPNVKLLISTTLVNLEQQNKYLSFAANNGFLENIEFLGFLDYKTIPDYLTLARVVVQPSIGQSMNLTIKEAMACGTPVVTSLEGREQFLDNTAGYLVDPMKTGELADRIIKILKDRRLAKKMGINGAKIIKEKFSWEAVSSKIEGAILLINK